MRFDFGYKREDWIKYFGERFNYNVGVIPIEENIIEKYSDCLDNSSGDAIVWLGNLNIDEEIGVYEIKIKNTKLTTRVKISKICTDVIRTGVGKSYGKGIFFILYSNDSDEIGKYRISYVKYDKKVDENFDIEKDLSNPKRFTYLLGEGAKVKTAASRLTKDAFTTVKKIEEAFSVEPVNEEFYNGIKKLFDKIYKDVLNNFKGKSPLSANETSAKEFSLRFLGRTLFCWFLREKDLIPKEIFDSPIFEEVKNNYYEEVLEELFFNVLNAKMDERKIISKIIKKYEKQIPFLNGGLFAKQKDDDKVKTIDNEIIKELFEFFSLYNFTVDESTPFDIEISIDPEMLGRIFENLLVAIDTNENFDIGNSTFYTPREIVDYMVKESIRLSLQNNTKNISEKEIEKIFNPNEDTKLSKKEIEELLSVLHEIKILDPACGSGAFPIGILQRVFMIIDKLDPNHEFYKKLLLKNIKGQAKIEFEKLYESKKFDYAYKLYILQNMIHGVDIQPIAIEISRLRAFLSLIVEEEKNEREDNLGIKPLPNLEFNFISANSLIPLEVKKDAQQSFNSMYVDGIVEKIKSISEDYFNSSSEKDKNNIKHRFEELRDFIVNNDYLEAKDKEKFLSWNPFDNYTAMFFNPQIQFGIKDKFDIVIANPPYYRFNNKKHTENIKFFRNNDLYKLACVRKINAYEVFLLFSYTQCKDLGIICEIFQNSFLADDAAKEVRKFYIDNTSIYKLLSFPERDNKNKRIFKNAKISVMILLTQKTIAKNNNFILEIYSDRMKTKKKEANINKNIIMSIDSENMDILNLNNEEIPIFIKCYKNNKKIGCIADTYEGELNVSFAKKYFTENKNKEKFLVGANIQKYYIANNPSQRTVPEYYDRKRYLNDIKKGSKIFHYNLERIAFQGITGMDDKYRIIATIIPKNYALANSANYLIIKDNVNISYEFLLGILNSSLINWLFNARSTNQNVNNYEINRLPFPNVNNKDTITIEKLVCECIAIKKENEKNDITDLQNKINKAVYRLYDINDNERKIIENGN
ncbi:Eco57I restriction-modification methylase domain-containing protein [Brachyspira sp.]|uniref:Eco57I restriction-modification methylase domain-containing protein n=1 Tax=Brachyspira sp. TaxID=1977261 RepID=UPI003D7C4D67